MEYTERSHELFSAYFDIETVLWAAKTIRRHKLSVTNNSKRTMIMDIEYIVMWFNV